MEGIEVHPFGFCSECLQACLDGTKPIRVHQLTDGSRMIESYCAERSVGALLHIRPGKQQRWKLTVPIDAVEWSEQAVPSHLGAREGLIAALLKPAVLNS